MGQRGIGTKGHRHKEAKAKKEEQIGKTILCIFLGAAAAFAPMKQPLPFAPMKQPLSLPL